MPNKLFVLAALLSIFALPVRADSSAASSVSDSASTSVGSLSNSLQNSSNSSSRNGGVAEGEYRLTDVAMVDEAAGTVRLHLEAVAGQGGEGGFSLELPRAAFEQSRLQPGSLVEALQRPYGMAFANAKTRQAFFLALRDDWLQELQTRAVKL